MSNVPHEPPASYVAMVVRHHAWAVQRLLETAALVPSAELQDHSLSHGSILETMRHVADVDQSWGRVAQGRQELDVAWMNEQLVDLPALSAFWLAEVNQLVAFASALSPTDLDRDVVPPWRKQPYAVWQVLLHISNHRAEHGNQIGWQLSLLGHSPGELGFMGFVHRERHGGS